MPVSICLVHLSGCITEWACRKDIGLPSLPPRCCRASPALPPTDNHLQRHTDKFQFISNIDGDVGFISVIQYCVLLRNDIWSYSPMRGFDAPSTMLQVICNF